MRIEDLSPSTTKISHSARPSSDKSSRLAGKPSWDGVELSRLSLALAGNPRIEHLRLSVKSGSYNIDPLEVSRRIVDEHLELT